MLPGWRVAAGIGGAVCGLLAVVVALTGLGDLWYGATIVLSVVVLAGGALGSLLPAQRAARRSLEDEASDARSAT